MINKSLALALAVLLLGVVNAGTVTLSGSCPSSLLNGSVLQFNLANSGNEAAATLVITPHAISASEPAVSGTYAVSTLNQSQSNTIDTPVRLAGEKGEFVYYFLVAYQQDGEVFSSVFPCLVKTSNSTADIILTSSGRRTGSGTASVVASVFNGGGSAHAVNVSIIVPPEFKAADSNEGAVVQPQSAKNYTFNLSYQASNSSYSAAVAATYAENGVQYAELSYLTLSASALPGKGLSQYYIFIAFGAVVLAVVLLIFRVLIRKSRKA